MREVKTYSDFFIRLSILCILSLLGACAEPMCRVPLPPEKPVETHPGVWAFVDTSKKTLSVERDGQQIAFFPGVALGAAGAGKKIQRGDDLTPIGRYRVVSVRHSEKFRWFIEIDYPSIQDAERALKERRIDRSTFDRIKLAHDNGKLPPQDTVLGGHIGIHGVGKGNIEIHRKINWTSGCLALDNDQICKLASLIRPGVVVDIQ